MRNLGIEYAKRCLKCGHIWLAYVLVPNRCPKCRKTTWNRDKKAPGRKPEFNMNILPGHNMLFKWSKDDARDQRLNRAIYAAQRKNPRLVAQARADGILVSWPVL
jgi:predicted  nucleic acid-binding Zn-ribbon protein